MRASFRPLRYSIATDQDRAPRWCPSPPSSCVDGMVLLAQHDATISVGWKCWRAKRRNCAAGGLLCCFDLTIDGRTEPSLSRCDRSDLSAHQHSNSPPHHRKQRQWSPCLPLLPVARAAARSWRFTSVSCDHARRTRPKIVGEFTRVFGRSSAKIWRWTQTTHKPGRRLA